VVVDRAEDVMGEGWIVGEVGDSGSALPGLSLAIWRRTFSLK
jgi:hypothetical protein